jgi:hypothetical protein
MRVKTVENVTNYDKKKLMEYTIRLCIWVLEWVPVEYCIISQRG